MAKSHYTGKFGAAKNFGLQSLYVNDISQYDNAKKGLGDLASGDTITAYQVAHGDPIGAATKDKSNQGLPPLEKMQMSFPSISKEKYNDILKSKPYLPKHHLRPNGGKNYGQTEKKRQSVPYLDK